MPSITTILVAFDDHSSWNALPNSPITVFMMSWSVQQPTITRTR